MSRRAGRHPRRRVVAGLALLAAALAGCGGDPVTTREDARLFARRALAGAGLAGVEVAPEVRLEACGSPRTEAWRTTSRVPSGGTVELCVPLEGDRAVYVRDAGPGDVGPLLTDAQFERLQSFRYDPAGARRRSEVFRAGTVAASLFALVVFALLQLRRATGRGRAGRQ